MMCNNNWESQPVDTQGWILAGSLIPETIHSIYSKIRQTIGHDLFPNYLRVNELIDYIHASFHA